MANLSIIVQDANNLTVDVTPQPATNITIDRGVAGNGIVSITLVDIDGQTYLDIVYTNGTSEQLGPLDTGVYFGISPITVDGNEISLDNTAVTAGTYGSASKSVTYTVDTKGRLTASQEQNIAIVLSQVTNAGTMAAQNANNVTITGGSISGTSVSGYVPTSEKGVALGVATLDSGGTVPLSQIPASIQGGLIYQGTWNASTNTPTLTSSVGSKGFYYAVSVAGSTNLNGITDWNIGDLAVFNGSVWEQIDNTDAVTSVNGYTGTVVLSYTDVGAFPATSTTGTGNVVLQTSPTINTPTLSGATIDGTAPYTNYTPTTAPTYVEGRVFYDSTAHTLNYYNDNNQMSVNIGQEQIIRVRNQTGSTIADGSVVYISGATGNTPLITLAIATSFATSDIIGVTTTNIPNNDFGYVTVNGLVNGLDTSAFTDGDPVFVSAITAGAYTATEPSAPNYSVQVGVVLRANPSNGTLLVSTQLISTEVSHIIGTVLVNQGGTGQTSYTNGQLLIGNTTGNTLTKSTLTAGTAIGITNGAGSITVNNTAPDQTVVLTAGTGISTSGTYPNFTITNTAPSSGGTVTSITAGTGLSGGTITSSGTIALANTAVSAGSYTNASLTVDAQGRLTAASSGTAPVTSVSGTSGQITSSGGTTPTVGLATTAVSAGSYTNTNLTVDAYGRITAATSGAAGGVTSVTGTAPISSSGGTTPAISISQATTSTNGYLSSTDWNTFNNKTSNTGTVTSITFGTGLTGGTITTSGSVALATSGVTAATYGSSTAIPVITVDAYGRATSITTAAVAGGQYYGTAATKAIAYNSNSIAENITILANTNGLSAGPITIATGFTVTVATDAVWVIV